MIYHFFCKFSLPNSTVAVTSPPSLPYRVPLPYRLSPAIPCLSLPYRLSPAIPCLSLPYRPAFPALPCEAYESPLPVIPPLCHTPSLCLSAFPPCHSPLCHTTLSPLIPSAANGSSHTGL